MATYNQTNTVLNSLMSQFRGTSGLTKTDLTGLISLGQASISSDNFKDAYGHAISDMVGKTVVRYLKSTLELPEIYRDGFEYGGILRKIRILPNQMKENESVKIGQNGYTPNPLAINKFSYSEKFFGDFDAWSDITTVPDDLFKKSFHSGEEYGAFIDGVMGSIASNFTAHTNLMGKTAVTNFIAEKIHATNGVINLRAEYNTATGESLTMNDCLKSQDFLRFAGMRIRNIFNYMHDDNTIFNVGHIATNTPDSEMLVYMLTDFVSAYNTYLLNGVSIFNTDFSKLPYYREMDKWQSPNTGANAIPTFAGNSAINVTTASGHDVSMTGIIGIIADREAIANTSEDIYVTTDRYNGARYTNYTHGAVEQYINDLDEQGVIFTIADTNNESNANTTKLKK